MTRSPSPFVFPAEPAREGFAADVLTELANFRRQMDERAARVGPLASAVLARQWPQLLTTTLQRCTVDTAAHLRRRVYSTLN